MMVSPKDSSRKHNRRDFLKKCASLAAGPATLGRIIPAFGGSLLSNRTLELSISAERPNFIVIMADDLSAREFSCYGNTEHHTPNIDKLAETGVMFKTCWCTPICSPTRAEIMTGRYGFRTGWYHNNMKPAAGQKGYNLSQDNLIFAQVLKNAGYATAICGKWQLRGTETQYGFDEWCMWRATEEFDGPIEPPEGNLPGRAARYWHPAIVRNGEQMDTDDDDYGPDIFTDFALNFAARHKDGPFLVYYPMVLIHKTWDFDNERMGYVAPPQLDENGQKTGNKGQPSLKGNVEYMDHLIGRVAKVLEDMGIRDNTIIMVLGDNGTSGYGKGKTDQEKGPRVPGVVNCPGIVEAIGPSDAIVDFSDIMATLLDMAGTRLPSGYVIDGHSFAPILRKESLGLRREKQQTREWIFSYLKAARFLRDQRWLLDGNGRFWDCGDLRAEQGYVDVTNSQDPEVLAARQRFEQILEELPAPTI